MTGLESMLELCVLFCIAVSSSQHYLIIYLNREQQTVCDLLDVFSELLQITHIKDVTIETLRDILQNIGNYVFAVMLSGNTLFVRHVMSRSMSRIT